MFEYCYALVKSDNIDDLYLEDGNVFRPVLKNEIETIFFKKPILVISMNLTFL